MLPLHHGHHERDAAVDLNSVFSSHGRSVGDGLRSDALRRCSCALCACACAPPASATTPSTGWTNGRIDHVADGDTVDLTNGARVRLVQIDTPEVYFRPECYGRRASAITKELLPPGTLVRLAVEPATDSVDEYGRLLRYVIRERDSLDINVHLVAVGAAAPYFYDGRRGRYAGLLDRLARHARARRLGLWGPCPGTPYRPGPRRRLGGRLERLKRGRPDSNRRRLARQASALPLSYAPGTTYGAGGIRTHGLELMRLTGTAAPLPRSEPQTVPEQDATALSTPPRVALVHARYLANDVVHAHSPALRPWTGGRRRAQLRVDRPTWRSFGARRSCYEWEKLQAKAGRVLRSLNRARRTEDLSLSGGASSSTLLSQAEHHLSEHAWGKSGPETKKATRWVALEEVALWLTRREACAPPARAGIRPTRRSFVTSALLPGCTMAANARRSVRYVVWKVSLDMGERGCRPQDRRRAGRGSNTLR